ncbi:MAG: class I SAM-dependent methyltransferase, partial [Leeuwenhoekiella sp.]
MSLLNKKSFEVRDHSISGEKFYLKYNQDYELWSTEPKPGLNELDKYYESSEYISHTDSNKNFTEFLYQLVKKWTFSYKFKLISNFSKGSKILDLGAGTGDFLAEAKVRNWQVDGIEPNNNARDLALKKGIALKNDKSEISDTFDVISMWHVLEHVYDLMEYIKFLKRHLKAQGLLLIAVPNYNSYDAKFYGSQWAALDVPRHLHHFSSSAIIKIFGEVDLVLVKKKPLFFDSF